MEEELKCGVCKQLFNNPVLLPCYHSVCLNCAVHVQQSQPVVSRTSTSSEDENASGGGSGLLQPPCTGGGVGIVAGDAASSSSTCSGGSVPDGPDSDKVSLCSHVSETDSGVVCSSRPNSYVGTPNMPPPSHPSSSGAASSSSSIGVIFSLACPVCRKSVYFDENGVHNLPKNRAMQNIVDRYGETRRLAVKCQLCVEGDGELADATVLCEQCEVLYCDKCRESCHPARGPLARHTLSAPARGKAALRAARNRQAVCLEHVDETLGMYCMTCKVPVCAMCLQDGRHPSHDVQALSAMCKAHKTELSQNLQTLSEKAKNTTELIQRLKSMSETLNESCTDLEKVIAVQCDVFVAVVRVRQSQLVDYVRQERDYRLRALKEQVGSCTGKLQQTTGLLQFCIEALKETDPTAFLQIGTALINRVSNCDVTWHRDMSTSPQVPPELDFALDDKPLLRAIEQLNFIHMKPPAPPTFIPEECCTENNSVTVVWQQHPASFVEGYVLELDDGNDGAFREVYCGKETICTVDGLHFNSLYNARVKAFNSTGEGDYGECICLQTAEVAWFTLDARTAHPDIRFVDDAQTSVTCDSYEHRLVLGSIGFSRGLHYWEFTIDRYESNADPAFGVARFDATKDAMLGKDDKGWSMYIDNQRSWFLHGDRHANRAEGGVEPGFVVGVLLDLDARQLNFYVNQEPQGSVIAFDCLPLGVFYPALSVNRSVQVTVQTALDPPTTTSSSSSVDPSGCVGGVGVGGGGGGVGGYSDPATATDDSEEA